MSCVPAVRMPVYPPSALAGMSLLLPLSEAELRAKDMPMFDEFNGFQPAAPALDRASHRLAAWSNHREDVVKRIFEIADELDSLKKKCDVSTVVGSSVGIAGGAAIIGGLVLCPPVAIAGIVVSSVSAAANIGTSITKVVYIKKRAKEVIALLKEDAKLYDVYCIHKEELAKENDLLFKDAPIDEPSAEAAGDADQEKEKVAMHMAAATATGISAAGARAALLETSRLAPAVMKGVAHGAAGVCIAIDLISLILSSKDLAKGEKSEYASHLREMATRLKQDMYEETGTFVHATLPN